MIDFSPFRTTPGRAPYRVIKRNKRLWIEDGDGQLIYTPPSFLRPVNRDGLRALAEALSLGQSYIKALIAFERDCRRG